MVGRTETVEITEDALERFALLPGEERARLLDSRLPGFHVVIGKRRVSFVVQRRIKGEKLQSTVTFGHWAPRKLRGLDAGIRDRTITVAVARGLAIEKLGQMRGGENPAGERSEVEAEGPTLARACALYLTSLRAEGKRPTSIASVEREIGHEERSYLLAWLDRPLSSITGKECRARHEQITTDNGPHVANRVMRQLRAIWNYITKEVFAGTVDGVSDFPANPTIAVKWNKESETSDYVNRRQEPIAVKDLPAWRAAVDELGEDRKNERGHLRNGSPIRRDYQLVVLLTGLRRMDAATIRWEHVNLSDETVTTKIWNKGRARWVDVELPPQSLHRPIPKGGKDRAFTIPLSSECVKILKRRKEENIGDQGWAFPAEAIKGKECALCASLGQPAHVAGARIHLTEPKEDSKILVSPHRLRDTYTTALADLKDPPLSPYAIDILTNHRPPRGTVTAGYVGTLDLADAQERVSAFLVGKMKPRRRA